MKADKVKETGSRNMVFLKKISKKKIFRNTVSENNKRNEKMIIFSRINLWSWWLKLNNSQKKNKVIDFREKIKNHFITTKME